MTYPDVDFALEMARRVVAVEMREQADRQRDIDAYHERAEWRRVADALAIELIDAVDNCDESKALRTWRIARWTPLMSQTIEPDERTWEQVREQVR